MKNRKSPPKTRVCLNTADHCRSAAWYDARLAITRSSVRLSFRTLSSDYYFLKSFLFQMYW